MMGRSLGDRRGRGNRSVILYSTIWVALTVSGIPPTRGQNPKPPNNDSPDQADFKTRLAIVPPARAGDAPLVVLRKAVGPKTYDVSKGFRHRLLGRELIRQAFLIAARDELGLVTRDEFLDDAPIPKDAADRLEISSSSRAFLGRMLVRQADKPAEKLLLKEFSSIPDGWTEPQELSHVLGPMSRTEIVEVLRKVGLTGKPKAFRVQAPVPRGVEEALRGLDLVDTFNAVRALHEAMRTDGESPERLGALARAYANLAALTCHQWSAAHRAFNARAFLYAERLEAKEKERQDSNRARWHWAYVLAMAGIEEGATEKVKSAEHLRKQGLGGVKIRPEWMEPIDAYVNHDGPRLAAVKGPFAKLARFLAMVSNEFPWGRRRSVEGAMALLEVAPECDRGYDVLSLGGMLGERRYASEAGPEAFGERIPARLAAAKDLPETVRKALKDRRDEPGVLAALAKAGELGADRGEPSWGVLARLVRDARYMYVLRRMTFMFSDWGVPVAEYWAEVRGLVAGHRYEPYLLFFADREAGVEALQAFAARADWSDLELTQRQLLDLLQSLKAPGVTDVWGFAVGHGSLSSRDLSLAVSMISNGIGYAREFVEVCPKSPYAAAVLMELDWGTAEPRLEGWKKTFADAPVFVDALAGHYQNADQFNLAIPLWEKYIKLSSDAYGYKNLAICKRATGDEAGWKTIMDRYLAETEALGLNHAEVQVQIAEFLLSKDKAAEAKPYADAAAETWAGWAMHCAGKVDEALKNWKSAEQWFQRTSERYPNVSWDEWLLFCMRTGRGDAREARALAAAAVKDPSLRGVDQFYIGCFLWTTGRGREALDKFESLVDDQCGDVLAFAIAALADEIGDKPRRDAMLQRLVAGGPNLPPAAQALARAFVDSLAGGGEAPADLKAIDAAIEKVPVQGRGFFNFYAYRFLKARGREAEARPYLERCEKTPPIDRWCRAMADEALRSSKAR